MCHSSRALYMEQALFGVCVPTPFSLAVLLTSFSQLTVVGMKHPDERVALQAIEFWSTVCEEEVDLALEAQEVKCLLSNYDHCLTELGTGVW